MESYLDFLGNTGTIQLHRDMLTVELIIIISTFYYLSLLLLLPVQTELKERGRGW